MLNRIKIAIVGPESTGKTALAESLAKHYKAVWEPELARDYIEKLDRPYTFDDVCVIARQQIQQEINYEQNTDYTFVFFDTDLIITKVWLEYCYQNIPAFVSERLEKDFFDFYLLCAPDLEWKPDKVREHGDDRDFFFDWYKREIELLKKPYAIVKGKGEKRLKCAIGAIEDFLVDHC